MLEPNFIYRQPANRINGPKDNPDMYEGGSGASGTPNGGYKPEQPPGSTQSSGNSTGIGITGLLLIGVALYFAFK